MNYIITYDPFTEEILNYFPKDDIDLELLEDTYVEIPEEFIDLNKTNLREYAVQDVPDLQTMKEYQKNEISNARYNEEISGLEVDGILIYTDDRSKALFTGVYNIALENPSFVTKWKKNDNTYVELTAPDIIKIYNALILFIESLFEKEAMLYELIDKEDNIEKVKEIVW